MSDIEDARTLLSAARRDSRALKGMCDPGVFADEVFGFHAQQAVEKALKAWIASAGHDYPLTHNLIVLLAQLEEIGSDIDEFWPLVELNAFAVQFRYAQYENLDNALDRSATTRKVEYLLDHVESVINSADGGN